MTLLTADQYAAKSGVSTSSSGSQPTSGNGFIDSIVNNLPAIGGGAGLIAGGIAGTPADLLTGPAGTMGGMALGAGLGGVTGKSLQNIAHYFEGQKQTPQGNITSALEAGAQQAPWGLLGAEGKLVDNPIGKALIRAGGGGLVGGGEKAFSNVQQGQPLMSGVPQAALATGGINTALGGGFDFMGGQSAGLQKDINQSLVQGPKKVLQSIYNDAMDSAFGHMNRDYAINEGIAPKLEDLSGQVKTKGFLNPNTINQMIDNVNQKAQEVHDNLNSVLSKSTHKVDAGALKTDLMQEFNLTDRAANPANYKRLYTLMKGVSLNNLVDVNDLKQATGVFWHSDNTGLAKGLYNKLQTYIEDNASEDVHSMNQEAQRLIDMGDKLEALKKSTMLPSGQSAAEIASKTAPKVTSQTPRMIALQGGAGLLGGAGSMALLQGITGNLGLSSAGGMGGMFLGRSVGQKLMENPQVLQSIAKGLESSALPAFRQLLTQLGVRNVDKLLGQ